MKKILFVVSLFIIGLDNVFAFSTTSRATVLMDSDTNNVLYENNQNEIRSVASISKIMTAIVAIESGKLDDIVKVGDEINGAYGSGIYIKIGEEISLRDLLYGLMLRSGNDAALAIAKYVGGDVETFVDMLNKKASEIGMKNTTFNNPSGLDEKKGNMSTAYDMALLMSYAIKNDEFKKIVGTKKHTVKTNMNYYSWINKNKLLFNYKYTTGGKTGFTEKAKRTLVTSASKNNINLVAVTLNDGNDFYDHINMYEEAFNNYTKYRILKSGKVNVIGENYYNNLIVKREFNLLLKDSDKNNVLLKYELVKKNNFSDNEVVGKVKLLLNNEKVDEQDVYVIKTQKKSFFQKIKDWLCGK